MKCLNCDKEIEQTGNKPKKYCSDNCRLLYFRRNETIGVKPLETIGNETIETANNETIGKDETDYETKIKYGRKYWENPAYLKTASDSMLQTILNVCYKGPDWIGTKAAQEVKARIPSNTPLKTAHLP